MYSFLQVMRLVELFQIWIGLVASHNVISSIHSLYSCEIASKMLSSSATNSSKSTATLPVQLIFLSLALFIVLAQCRDHPLKFFFSRQAISWNINSSQLPWVTESNCICSFRPLFSPSIYLSLWLPQSVAVAISACFIEILFAFGFYTLELW